MNSIEIKAYVDRFEDDAAILLIGDEGRQVDWPVEHLPEGVREGSVLRVIIRLDEDATKQAEDIVDSLIERLQSGD